MAETLTQTQIIQSLGEALAWFEKELAWGVKPAELNHLTGRIGELYVALIKRGQMALSAKQPGYDVVSQDGLRISVKTQTTVNPIKFNASTFDKYVDHVVVLRILVDDDSGVSIEEVFDMSAADTRLLMTENKGEVFLNLKAKSKGYKVDVSRLTIVGEVKVEDFVVRRFENGHIQVEHNGELVIPARPKLKELAEKVGVDFFMPNGRGKTTQQLGSQIIKVLSPDA